VYIGVVTSVISSEDPDYGFQVRVGSSILWIFPEELNEGVIRLQITLSYCLLEHTVNDRAPVLQGETPSSRRWPRSKVPGPSLGNGSWINVCSFGYLPERSFRTSRASPQLSTSSPPLDTVLHLARSGSMLSDNTRGDNPSDSYAARPWTLRRLVTAGAHWPPSGIG
jgi:hypothetical protein